KGFNQHGCTCARDVAKRGGLTIYGLFCHTRLSFALVVRGTCLIVAFFGLDRLGLGL
ncbi:unnamed protein product, partial [Penicillium nalgiovense]